jgi:hypothetical protein
MTVVRKLMKWYGLSLVWSADLSPVRADAAESRERLKNNHDALMERRTTDDKGSICRRT